jgi:hypothetical protein
MAYNPGPWVGPGMGSEVRIYKMFMPAAITFMLGLSNYD